MGHSFASVAVGDYGNTTYDGRNQAKMRTKHIIHLRQNLKNTSWFILKSEGLFKGII